MKRKIKVSNKVRHKLETFLHNYPAYEEQGGFLLGHRGQITEFLPVTNISAEPKSKFEYAKGSYEMAQKLCGYKRSVEAFWHSHPTPCIMSAADLGYAQSHDLVFVTISPISIYGTDYIWFACKGIRPVKVEFY